jgi:serine/threonine protein kinase
LLSHPNIVSIFDTDFHGGYYYIATEFIQGKTLREMLAGEPQGLETQVILDIVTQTTSALTAAHELGIVHRDIKPENIMVRPDGFVKLLDFGLAKQREQTGPPGTGMSELRTRPGVVAGTIQYLSLEQVAGKPVDGRSDLFSLGVVAYELATGRRPFEGPTDGAVFDATLNRTPPVPSSIRPELGREFDSLIMQALEKDAELRFQTASDLGRACRRLSRDSSQQISQKDAFRTPPIRKTRSRKTWILLTLAAAAVACAAYVLYQGLRSHPPAAPWTLVSETSYPGSEMYPAFSPDGKQIAFFWEGDRGANPGIYVKLAGEPNPLRLTSGVDSYPLWTPDGKRITFARAGSKPGIYSVSVLGGMERKLYSLQPQLSDVLVAGRPMARDLRRRRERARHTSIACRWRRATATNFTESALV